MAYALTKQEITREIVRCGKDPAYFLDNYARITHQEKGIIPFKTFNFQKQLLNDFHDHRFNIILKARQLGISTIVSGYVAWMLMFYKEKNVLVMATKLNTAIEIVDKVKDIIESVPEWLKIVSVATNNKTKFELSNGSRIQGTPTSKDAGRGQALSLLIVDEAAFVDDMDDLWTGLLPTISTGGRCIALSTPNGVGNWFHKTYVEADSHNNNFKATRLPWNVHPDYTEQWFANMTKNMSRQKIAQEFECVTGETRIVTKDGYKNICDINIGDEVLTHKGHFKKVLDKRSKTVDKKEVYKISFPYSRTNPLYITGNHPLLIATKKEKTKERIQTLLKKNLNNVQWNNLEEIQNIYSDYVTPQYMNMLFPTISENIFDGSLNNIDLSKNKLTKEYDEYNVRYNRQEGSSKRFIDVDYKLGKLLGLFSSEGNYISSGGLQFSFNSSETNLISFIKEFCDNYKFKLSIHERKKSNCTVIIIYNKFLLSIVKEFINGRYCYDKIFNESIYKTNKKFIHGIIAGIWLGDGLYNPKNKNIISLANEKLIYQLRLLMFYSGFITRVSSKFNNKDDIRTQYLLELNNTDGQDIEQLLLTGIDINSIAGSRSIKNSDGWWGRISEIVKNPSELEEEVLVYNIEVEEDNSYICENLTVHNCNFNASGETVIAPQDIERIKKTIKEPKHKTWIDRNYYIWEEFNNDGSYLLSADVARGDGRDYSVFHVINVKTMQQVAEYQGKIDIDSFARLLMDVGKEYGNCMLVVENNNVGFAVLTKLIEFGYPNIFYSTKGSNDFLESSAVDYTSNSIPGFTTSMKTRPLIIAKLEEFIRNKLLVISSQRLINELDTFVWHNGKPEAQKGYNDDLVMSMAIACWVRDTCIVNNDRNLEYSKVMLNAMMSSRSTFNSTINGMRNHERSLELNKQAQEYLNYMWVLKG
jgi:hypothetical protein